MFELIEMVFFVIGGLSLATIIFAISEYIRDDQNK